MIRLCLLSLTLMLFFEVSVVAQTPQACVVKQDNICIVLPPGFTYVRALDIPVGREIGFKINNGFGAVWVTFMNPVANMELENFVQQNYPAELKKHIAGQPNHPWTDSFSTLSRGTDTYKVWKSSYALPKGINERSLAYRVDKNSGKWVLIVAVAQDQNFPIEPWIQAIVAEIRY